MCPVARGTTTAAGDALARGVVGAFSMDLALGVCWRWLRRSTSPTSTSSPCCRAIQARNAPPSPSRWSCFGRRHWMPPASAFTSRMTGPCARTPSFSSRPVAPGRRPAPAWLASTLRVDPQIVAALLGHSRLDERLVGVVRYVTRAPSPRSLTLPAVEFVRMSRIARAARADGTALRLVFSGRRARRRATAAALARQVEAPLLEVDMAALLASANPRETLRVALREARFSEAIPSICHVMRSRACAQSDGPASHSGGMPCAGCSMRTRESPSSPSPVKRPCDGPTHSRDHRMRPLCLIRGHPCRRCMSRGR